jgi:hypothetical protein
MTVSVIASGEFMQSTEMKSSLKFVLLTIFSFCFVELSACMYMPAARDDFSVMEVEPFSNLIRSGQYEQGDPQTGRSVGVSMLDPIKLTTLSRTLFFKKSFLEVVELFAKHGGICAPSRNGGQIKLLTCSIERHWKLKNIGAPFDTSNWSDPAIRLIYRFTITDAHSGLELELELEIIDITLAKQIKG